MDPKVLKPAPFLDFLLPALELGEEKQRAIIEPQISDMKESFEQERHCDIGRETYIYPLWASYLRALSGFMSAKTPTTDNCHEDERGLFYKAYSMGPARMSKPEIRYEYEINDRLHIS